jgi:hypothetical protein
MSGEEQIGIRHHLEALIKHEHELNEVRYLAAQEAVTQFRTTTESRFASVNEFRGYAYRSGFNVRIARFDSGAREGTFRYFDSSVKARSQAPGVFGVLGARAGRRVGVRNLAAQMTNEGS